MLTLLASTILSSEPLCYIQAASGRITDLSHLCGQTATFQPQLESFWQWVSKNPDFQVVKVAIAKGREDVIQDGWKVCQHFDGGGTREALLQSQYELAQREQLPTQYFAAVDAAAPMYLCPKHKTKNG